MGMANPFILLVLTNTHDLTNSINCNNIRNDLAHLTSENFAITHPYKLCEWKQIISLTSWTFEELYKLTFCFPYLRDFILAINDIDFNDNDFLFEVCFDEQPFYVDLLWREVILKKYPNIVDVSNKKMTHIYMNAVLNNDVNTLHFIFKCTNYIIGNYIEGEYPENSDDFPNYIYYSDYCKYYDEKIFGELEILFQKERIVLYRDSLIIHPLIFAVLCTDDDSFFSYVKYDDIAIGYTFNDYCPVYTYCSYKKGYSIKSYYEEPEDIFDGYLEEIYVVVTSLLRVQDI